MSLLMAGKENEQTTIESHQLTSKLSRAGLWGITTRAQTLFQRTEKYFRFYTSNYPLTRIDIHENMTKSTNDLEVLSAFNLLKANSELRLDVKVAMDVLQSIAGLYIRVRSFSFAKDVVQKYKIQSKLLKEKALRKEINRASKESERPRQP